MRRVVCQMNLIISEEVRFICPLPEPCFGSTLIPVVPRTERLTNTHQSLTETYIDQILGRGTSEMVQLRRPVRRREGLRVFLLYRKSLGTTPNNLFRRENWMFGRWRWQTLAIQWNMLSEGGFGVCSVIIPILTQSFVLFNAISYTVN